jgi:hypothetical protein
LIPQFKERVIDKVTQEYMKSDIFIIRWLREKDFNLEEAEKLLMNVSPLIKYILNQS